MNSAEDRAIPPQNAPGVRLKFNQDWRHPTGTIAAGTVGTVVRKFQGYQIITDPCTACGVQRRLDLVPAGLLNMTGDQPTRRRGPNAARDHHVDAQTYAALNSQAVQGKRVTLVDEHETREFRLPAGRTGRITGKYRGYQVDFDPCPRCALAPRITAVPHEKLKFIEQ